MTDIVVHEERCQCEPGCLLPVLTTGEVARHRQFFCTQFTFYFDTLTISKLSHMFNQYAQLAILLHIY